MMSTKIQQIATVEIEFKEHTIHGPRLEDVWIKSPEGTNVRVDSSDGRVSKLFIQLPIPKATK